MTDALNQTQDVLDAVAEDMAVAKHGIKQSLKKDHIKEAHHRYLEITGSARVSRGSGTSPVLLRSPISF